MLAQNFMTAEALGISEKEQTSLITVLGMLERSECDNFSMRMITRECGTPGCILGWAEYLHTGRKYQNDFLVDRGGIIIKGRTDALERLFFPLNEGAANSEDQSEAALALRNYLTTGEPHWAEVLA